MINKISTLMDVFEKAWQTKPRLFVLAFLLGTLFSYYVFKHESDLDDSRLNELKQENEGLKSDNKTLHIQASEAYNRGRMECMDELEKTYKFLKEITK